MSLLFPKKLVRYAWEKLQEQKTPANNCFVSWNVTVFLFYFPVDSFEILPVWEISNMSFLCSFLSNISLQEPVWCWKHLVSRAWFIEVWLLWVFSSEEQETKFNDEEGRENLENRIWHKNFYKHQVYKINFKTTTRIQQTPEYFLVFNVFFSSSGPPSLWLIQLGIPHLFLLGERAQKTLDQRSYTTVYDFLKNKRAGLHAVVWAFTLWEAMFLQKIIVFVCCALQNMINLLNVNNSPKGAKVRPNKKENHL